MSAIQIFRAIQSIFSLIRWTVILNVRTQDSENFIAINIKTRVLFY